MIQSVLTGSFADLQGLEPGLVIIRINKQPTSTKTQYDSVVGRLKTGDDVVFKCWTHVGPAMELTTSAARCNSTSAEGERLGPLLSRT